MVAAEDGALPGGKVGGMGDVLRDLPEALAELGHEVTVLTPGYGRFSTLPGARQLAAVEAAFGGGREQLALLSLPARGAGGRVTQRVLEHPAFAACGRGQIYCSDPDSRPFATDAGKFALFCAGAAAALASGALPRPDVLHLHDWHSGFLPLLLPRGRAYRSVLTIHNLAMQGIRPLRGDPSSLDAWFPGLVPPAVALDPRYADCINPLRTAIGLCDRVHTVSPTYAAEICDPDGLRGEGLQRDLARARDEGRLFGILNGCSYEETAVEALPFAAMLELARGELERWLAAEDAASAAHLLALRRIDRWLAMPRPAPPRLLTFVGRLTDQKFGLLARPGEDGLPALDGVLDALEGDELLLVLGSGDAALERSVAAAQQRHERLLFLRGYSEPLSEQLYAAGDLFLMPSRFEPCGIAQLFAMRAGQPCLVNRTGGLADTVRDEVDGFVFEGATDAERAAALQQRLRSALTRLRHHPRKRAAMRAAARAARFPWSRAARACVEQLYAPG
jgi:starch synthase